MTGTPQDATFTASLKVPYGTFPGDYTCYTYTSDVLDHYSYVWNAFTLTVNRSSGTFDDAAPVLTTTVNTNSVEVGTADATVEVTMHATDATGVSYAGLQ